METAGVGEQESGYYGVDMGDTQVGGGPHVEAVDAGTYMGDAQVGGIPSASGGEIAGLGVSYRDNGGREQIPGSRGWLEKRRR